MNRKLCQYVLSTSLLASYLNCTSTAQGQSQATDSTRVSNRLLSQSSTDSRSQYTVPDSPGKNAPNRDANANQLQMRGALKHTPQSVNTSTPSSSPRVEQPQDSQSLPTDKPSATTPLTGEVESNSIGQKPLTGSTSKDATNLNANANQLQTRGALKHAPSGAGTPLSGTTIQVVPPQQTAPQISKPQVANPQARTQPPKTQAGAQTKSTTGNKEVYLNIQDGTVSQNGGPKKGLQIGDNRLNIVGKARFEVKGPGEIRIKGRGCLSVIGSGVIEIDQTPVIKAFNFDAVTTVDNLKLDATDCGHVSASSPATINADHCDMVVSMGDANIKASHCKTISLVYSNAEHRLKDGVLEASDCKDVTFSGGELDESVWQAEPPRLIATNCEVVRIYNGSARAIGCSRVELFGGKLEVKNCDTVKNLKPDSNKITEL